MSAQLPEGNLFDFIVENNLVQENKTLVEYFGKKISVKEFIFQIKKLACSFVRNGITVGDTVTLMSLVTPESLYCIYALNFLGVTVNSVYISMSDDEIITTVKNTDSKLLIVIDVLSERIDSISDRLPVDNIVVLSPRESLRVPVKWVYDIKNSKHICKSTKIISFKEYSHATRFEMEKIEEKHQGNADAVALIVYTSGSTGEPKGVMLSNRNINSVALQYMNTMDFEFGDSFLCFIPPFFSIGFCLATHMPLALGLKVMICPDPTPENVSKTFLRLKPNHYVGVPSNNLQIINMHKKKLTYVKTFAAGGSSATKEQVDNVNNVFVKEGSQARMITGYGMTEFSATVTTERNDVYRRGSIGIPLPLVNVMVVDTDTCEEKMYNEVGELFFTSPGQMMGYYKNAEETTAIKYIDKEGREWLRTGDLGKVDEDGFIYFEGRVKRIYLKQGADGTIYKIFPQRVEELINNLNFVKECAVIAVPDEILQHAQIAYIVLNGRKNDYEKEIKEVCKLYLPDFMVPEEFVFIDSMPKLSNGKIDYQSLIK